MKPERAARATGVAPASVGESSGATVSSDVRLVETFLWDMTDITLYILEQSASIEIPRRFYNDVLASIEERAFGADSYEPYYDHRE